MSNTRCLINKKDLKMFNAELAAEIGLNEAIFLQQVHYWLSLNEEVGRNFKEGRYWTYNTYDEWIEKSLPFWSKSTLRRAVKNLEKQGLLISDNFNKAKFDKTKWLTIDYDKLKEVEDKVYGKKDGKGTVQNEQTSVQDEQTNCSEWTSPSVQNEQNNTIDLPKTSTISKYVKGNPPPEDIEANNILDLAAKRKQKSTDIQTGASNIRQAIEQVWKKNTVNPNVLIELLSYSNKLSDEIVLEAMARSKFKDRPFNYCKAILDKCIKQNITSVSQMDKSKKTSTADKSRLGMML